MHMTNIIQFIIITFFLIAASICDITTGKIKNWLTFPALLTGLAYTFVYARNNLQSTIIFLVAMFILGCIGLSGWGDIKCVMALAALSDWKVAAAAFVGSQALLFIKYLILTPKQAIKDVRENAIQLSERKISIERTQEKHLLAPFLLASYIIVSIIFHFIR